MDSIRHILLILDPVLILPFRVPGPPLLGYFLGLFALSLWCMPLGDAAGMLVTWLNRGVYGQYAKDMVHHHNLSIRAAQSGDKANFRAVNKQAHEAFGKYFFSQAAVFTATLWPVPFALAWLDLRFRETSLPLPLVDFQADYVFFFIPLYILARLLYPRLMARIPGYRRFRMAAAFRMEERPEGLDDPGEGGGG